jgi:hypothetical protein
MDKNFYEYATQIDDLLENKFVNNKIYKSLKRLISSDDDLKEYFFTNVKNVCWFKWLSKEQYFNPSNIKVDQDGNFFSWNVLNYLKHVSEQLDENPEYGEELITIINNTINYSQTVKQIKSDDIWYPCVEIVNNIPNKILIKKLTVEQFYIWLTVWTDTSSGKDFVINEIGTNLLPKFLNDDNCISYAEAIIDFITEIRISKHKDVILTMDAYWIKETFKNNYELIGKKCSSSVIINLANKLKTALDYDKKSTWVNFNIDNSVYQIKVIRVPTDGLREEKIGFREGHYICEIKQYEQNQIEDIDLQNRFWELHAINPQVDIKSFNINTNKIGGLAQAIKENLPVGINWTKDNQLEEKIEWIFEGLYSDNLHIWFKSLAEANIEYGSEADKILPIILRDVLLVKCENSHLEGKNILADFLSNKYLFTIFRRLALLCIDKYWSLYSNYLERFFTLFHNALDEPEYEVELQDILSHHNTNFNDVVKSIIKDCINNVPHFYTERGEKNIAYWKYQWLSPLRDNPDFSTLYEEVKIIVEPENNRPYKPRRSTIQGGLVKPISPISAEEILQKPISELVKYLNDFEGPNERDFFSGEPNKGGLVQTLRAVAKDNPKKFTDGLLEFCTADHAYLQSIFIGLDEAWKANSELDWNMIFNFALKYFEQDKKYILEEANIPEGEDSGKGKYIWVVDQITNLIAEGCKNDERAFDPQYFDKVESIFNLIFPLLKSGGYPDKDKQGNIINYAFDTTFGRTVQSYISFSLRVARASEKKEKDWGINKFERFFKAGHEAVIWFGCYLPQMIYLDEKYAKEKIDFFSKKSFNDQEWQMFMNGYLDGSRQVYKDVYNIMRLNYFKVLERSDIDKSMDERLVQHICIAYLYYDAPATNKKSNDQRSLFWKMLKEVDTTSKRNRWLETAKFLWTHIEQQIRTSKENEEELTKTKNRILDFWSWTYKKKSFVKKTLLNDYETFLAWMANLTIILDRINQESGKWLLLSAPHVKNDYFFVQYLTKFDDEESIKRVGKIFLKILGKTKTIPIFPQKTIELIVTGIYEKGDRRDADKICNIYGKRKLYFLKPIWEKHHEKLN